MPSPPSPPVVPLSRTSLESNSQRLEVCPPGTAFVGASANVQLPGDAYALFAGEEVAKALNAALCAMLDVPRSRGNELAGVMFHDIMEAHKPVLGLVRDTLSASILGRKCSEGTL